MNNSLSNEQVHASIDKFNAFMQDLATSIDGQKDSMIKEIKIIFSNIELNLKGLLQLLQMDKLVYSDGIWSIIVNFQKELELTSKNLEELVVNQYELSDKYIKELRGGLRNLESKFQESFSLIESQYEARVLGIEVAKESVLDNLTYFNNQVTEVERSVAHFLTQKIIVQSLFESESDRTIDVGKLDSLTDMGFSIRPGF